MQNPIKKRKKDILLRNICANTFCNHSIQLSRIFVREEEEERPSEWILLFLRPNPVDGTWPRTNFHVRSVLLSEVLLPGLKCTAIVRVHVNEDESSHQTFARISWLEGTTPLRRFFQSRYAREIERYRMSRVYYTDPYFS